MGRVFTADPLRAENRELPAADHTERGHECQQTGVRGTSLTSVDAIAAVTVLTRPHGTDRPAAKDKTCRVGVCIGESNRFLML